eukprot:GEZU01009939.1.p1 GENE.GEZU01009939.1~~GEZU01009939.1.p1  ORF type:complete len:382 (+),score=41.05 GEZU01009939.1:58-1203(+)
MHRDLTKESSKGLRHRLKSIANILLRKDVSLCSLLLPLFFQHLPTTTTMASGEDAKWTDHYVSINGFNLHYLVWKPVSSTIPNNKKTTLVCIHGSFSSAHTWDGFARVAAGYDSLNSNNSETSIGDSVPCQVICLDLRGYGDSDWCSSEVDATQSYTIAECQKDLNEFFHIIEETALIGPEDRVILVGMSFGGLVAMKFASGQHTSMDSNNAATTTDYSKLLDGLVVVDITPEIKKEGTQQIRDFVNKSDVLPTFEAFIERAHQMNPRRSKEELREKMKHYLKQRPEDGQWTWKYDPRWKLTFSTQQLGDKIWEEVSRIRVPTLLVRGAESTVTTPESIERLRRAIPLCTSVEIPRAGHSAHADNVPDFSRAVLNFLQQQQ